MVECNTCTVDIGSTLRIDYGFTVTGNRIADAVLDFVGESWDEISSKDRRHPIVWYRQGCMYLIKKYTSMSLAKIGQPFSGKDHATVIHAVRTIRNLYETDIEVRHFIDSVEKILHENGDIRKIIEYDKESSERDYTRPLLSDDTNKWTQGEYVIIEKLYEDYTAKEIAGFLHRSVSSVTATINRMGIYKPISRIKLQNKNVNYLK